MSEHARTSSPRVAYQGEAGAFSEEAIHAWFGSGRARPLPCREFQGIADAVTSGEAELGMLPVENSIAGSVTGAFDVLRRGDLVVLGEIVQPIRHCLLGVPGAAVTQVRRVTSHPVALAQCMRFLSTLEGAESVAIYDTAGAAREVSERRLPEVAAVAGRGAAERYGLTILAEDIQDRPDNQTRFFIVAGRDANNAATERRIAGDGPPAHVPASATAAGPADRRQAEGDGRRPQDDRNVVRKTLLLLETQHRAGALSEVLQPFAAAGISLAHIIARPGDEPWHYRFFLEVEADHEDPAAAEAIAIARGRAYDLLVLGSFDCAVRR